MKKEFLKIGLMVPKISLANPRANTEEIIRCLYRANEEKVEVIATPELALSGATCGDLFFQEQLINNIEKSINDICYATNNVETVLIIGTPLKINNNLYNVALIIHKGSIIGFVPKKNLSWIEKRWFSNGSGLFEKEVEVMGKKMCFNGNVFTIPNTENSNYAVMLTSKQVEYINKDNKTIYALINITSDFDLVSKTDKIKGEIINISKENGIAYAYVMPGINESSADYVYSGYSLIVDDGEVKCEGKKFSFDSEMIFADVKLNDEENNYVMQKESFTDKKILKERDKYPFVPSNDEAIKERAKEVLEMQSAALARRLLQIRSNKMVLGLSGGSDSTLALIVCVETCKKLNIGTDSIIAITMPGFGTTGRTYNNAVELAKSYKVTLREISIKDSCVQHFKDIGLKEGDYSITYENAQARERTQILMDVANMEKGLVIGTGDLSELALGWCTYNGDHMSMYAVNANIPKTLIKHLIKYEAEKTNNQYLFDIINTPISPELLPPDENGDIAQQTEDSVGPYSLHDFFIYHFIKYHSTPAHILDIAKETFKDEFSEEDIKKWLNVFLKRFITQQFKRDCVPDGPKVGSVGFSPRGDLMMPSDADNSIWSI